MEKRIRLDDLARKHPYKVPEGYFDSLSSKIMERVEQSSLEKQHDEVIFKPSRRWWSLATSAAVAASIVLIGALIWITLPEKQGPLDPDTLFSVSDEAILDYLEAQDLDFYDLASQEVILKAFSQESAVIHFLDGVDEEMIRQYLNEDTLYDETI